jgi:hypothetical protein
VILGNRINAIRSRALCILSLVLVGCADHNLDAATRDWQDARFKVFVDAMFYWRCAHDPLRVTGACNRWLEAYRRDNAVLMTIPVPPDIDLEP